MSDLEQPEKHDGTEVGFHSNVPRTEPKFRNAVTPVSDKTTTSDLATLAWVLNERNFRE